MVQDLKKREQLYLLSLFLSSIFCRLNSLDAISCEFQIAEYFVSDTLNGPGCMVLGVLFCRFSRHDTRLDCFVWTDDDRATCRGLSVGFEYRFLMFLPSISCWIIVLSSLLIGIVESVIIILLLLFLLSVRYIYVKEMGRQCV